MKHHLSVAHFFCVSLLTVFSLFCSEPVQDPYQEAHQLFAQAATQEDYENTLQAYAQSHENVQKNQLAIATTNKGESELALGDIETGFAHREARLDCPQDARLFKAGTFAKVSKTLRPGTNVTDCTVAVYCDEGGIGDIYFFARCMKKLQEQGAKVIGVATTAFVQKILNTLKGQALDETALFTDGYNAFIEQEYDYDIHMMSLPTCVSSEGISPTTLSKIIQPGYLQGNTELVNSWKEKIRSKKGLHIAYCFAASKQAAGVYRRLERDIEPTLLEQTMSLASDNCQLYCIQGPGYTPASNIVDISVEEQKHGVPFAQTIALLQALRESENGLFVGVDTGPTNAALAVGTRGFVLLPRIADWRWGVAKTKNISEDTTPSAWAPTLKLLRQEQQGDWNVPLKNLTTELKKLNKKIKED